VKLDAILLDLDNTLLMFNENEFFKTYNSSLYTKFTDLLKPDELFDKMMTATHRMVRNDGQQTNLELFMDEFCRDIQLSRQEIWTRFDKFYRNDFDQFRTLVTKIPGVYEILHNIQEQGLKTVIATNPMFPDFVQRLRLDWAGLNLLDFNLITGVENSYACKPSLKYYQDICAELKLIPENCLMVGNDALNDIVAGKIGMKTMLVSDSSDMSIELSRELSWNEDDKLPVPDYRGSIQDLPGIVAQLMEKI